VSKEYSALILEIVFRISLDILNIPIGLGKRFTQLIEPVCFRSIISSSFSMSKLDIVSTGSI
jgi:hypothetical protein